MYAKRQTSQPAVSKKRLLLFDVPGALQEIQRTNVHEYVAMHPRVKAESHDSKLKTFINQRIQQLPLIMFSLYSQALLVKRFH